MKIKKITLIAFLSMMAFGCQKENHVESTFPVIETKASFIMTVRYSVNGVVSYTSFNNETELDAFYDYLLGLAYNGATVIISNNNLTSQSLQNREVVTYTTQNVDDAKKWSKKKVLEGYEVEITYDEETGYYTCTARK